MKKTVRVKYLRILILFAFIFFMQYSYASVNDSLFQLLGRPQLHDTARIDILHKIGFSIEPENPDSAIKWYSKALDIALNKIKSSGNSAEQFKFLAAASYRYIGIANDAAGNFGAAIRNYQQSRNLYNELLAKNNKEVYRKGICAVFSNLGIVYTNLGEFNKAIENHQYALHAAEEMGDETVIALSNINIGVVHWNQQNYDAAIGYYQKAYEIYLKRDDKKNLAVCLSNMGIILDEQTKFLESIRLYFKALEIYKELNDEFGQSSCYTNIGGSYLVQGFYDKAIEYYQKSLDYQKRSGDKKRIAMLLGNLALTYIQKEEFAKAIDLATQSLCIAKETGNLVQEKEDYSYLYEAYNQQGDTKNALKFHVLFKQINDSIFNEVKNGQITEMEARYQSESKQQQIELLNKDKALKEEELKKQAILRNSLIAGFLLMIVVVVLVFNSYRQKKISAGIIEQKNRNLEQANAEISAQRDAIELHLNISEQQRKLITHQKKELTDSINYAQRIQRAILPPDYFVKKCLPESFIMYLPKDVVSGDFYYIEKINEFVIFSAVDCTGHGVPGSMMSVIGYNLINQAVKLNRLTKPSDILSFLDAGVTETLRQERGESGVNDGMDLAVCTLNTVTNLLQFAGAYNGVVYIKGNELTEIKADNRPIGINFDGLVDTYTNHEIQLDKGDMVYLYSDGYADQFGGPKGKKFKYKPLKDLLLKNASQPVNDQKEILAKTFFDWKGNVEQVDDVMVIGVKI